MSKTWKIPVGTEQAIERMAVRNGDMVKAGAVIAEMRILRFQGAVVNTDMPIIPVSAPIDGRVLFWPGMSVGTGVAEGTKVFSVLSQQDWDDLAAAAGMDTRTAMEAIPQSISREMFEVAMNKMTDMGIKRMFGGTR